MYRLMIVDDDEILRDGLVNNIPWVSHNIEVVATARNGKEALEKIEETMPNIIMSDIMMPFMDGLALAECVNKLYPKIKVILLTAYEEFEYAKKALHSKVCAYILKYETNENILQAVLDTINRYSQEIEIEKSINRNRIFIIKNFFREISLFKHEKEEITNQMQSLNLSFSEKYFCAAAFHIEKKKDMAEREFIVKRQEWFHIVEDDLTKDLVELECHAYWFYHKEYMILTILAQDRISQKEADTLLERKAIMFGFDLFIGVGMWQDDIANLHRSFIEALKLISIADNNFNGSRVLYYSADMENQGTLIESIDTVTKYIEDNYFEESLSLSSISKQIHLSPNYVSTLFKKYKGINISDYIIKVRIKKAEELLVSTNYKTYEIADKIGYKNSQYFSILFKRSTGLSPTDYRQKYKSA